jgi:hypothetical protein
VTQSDLQQIRLGYLRGVLAERWPVPSRIPTLLAFSRDSNVTAIAFGRLGFRVEEISADDPLDGVRQQLPGRKPASTSSVLGLAGAARRLVLSPQPLVGLGHEVGPALPGPAWRNHAVSYMGYAIRQRDRAVRLWGAA